MADRRIVLNLPPDLPLIHVDPVLVQQALVQIFDNAVKYSAPGSQISVAARARDGRMILSISDEGAGLTAAEQTQDLGAFRARRAPRRDHQRFRPRPVDRQRLYRRQWRQR